MTAPISVSVQGRRLYTWYSQNVRLYISSFHIGVLGGEGNSKHEALENLAILLESLAQEVRTVAKVLRSRSVLQ